MMPPFAPLDWEYADASATVRPHEHCGPRARGLIAPAPRSR